jgi:zeaxanthin glucosyltransferase
MEGAGMGRILFLSSSERAAVNALAPVKARLFEGGHEVDWAQLDHEVEGEPDEAARPRILRDRRAYRGWLRARLLEPIGTLLEQARMRLRLFAPDVVVTPPDFYPGVLAAEREGVRWIGVTASCSIAERRHLDYEMVRAIDALAAERRATFAALGSRLEFRAQHALSPHGTLVLVSEALLAGATLPPRVRAVGPALSAHPRGDEPWFPRWRVRPQRPLIMVSFGSRFAWQPELLTVVARAVAPFGGQLVLGAGALADTTFPLTLPGDVLALPYLPQLELLASADVLVTHGGAVSVMEATARGVPLLVLPLGEDHPAQAKAVEQAGVGITVEPGTLAEARVRTALLALVDGNGGHRRRARAIAEATRQNDGDGAAGAAEVIGSLAVQRGS